MPTDTDIRAEMDAICKRGEAALRRGNERLALDLLLILAAKGEAFAAVGQMGPCAAAKAAEGRLGQAIHGEYAGRVLSLR